MTFRKASALPPRIGKFLTLVLLVLFPTTLSAKEPQAGISSTVDELLVILYGPNKPKTLAKREAKVQQAIEKRYSLGTIVTRALGRNRSKANASQRKEITRLTTALIVRTYTRRFNGAKRPTVSYGKVAKLRNGTVELPSTVKLGGSNYSVRYRCSKVNGRWTLYDIVIQGVVLSANYRKQFDNHFRKGNADQLIAKLKAQLAK